MTTLTPDKIVASCVVFSTEEMPSACCLLLLFEPEIKTICTGVRGKSSPTRVYLRQPTQQATRVKIGCNWLGSNQLSVGKSDPSQPALLRDLLESCALSPTKFQFHQQIQVFLCTAELFSEFLLIKSNRDVASNWLETQMAPFALKGKMCFQSELQKWRT